MSEAAAVFGTMALRAKINVDTPDLDFSEVIKKELKPEDFLVLGKVFFLPFLFNNDVFTFLDNLIPSTNSRKPINTFQITKFAWRLMENLVEMSLLSSTGGY